VGESQPSEAVRRDKRRSAPMVAVRMLAAAMALPRGLEPLFSP